MQIHSEVVFQFSSTFDCESIVFVHYHLQVQANPKKMAQKNDAIFSIYERNGIIPLHLFQILSWAFRGRWGRMTSNGQINHDLFDFAKFQILLYSCK